MTWPPPNDFARGPPFARPIAESNQIWMLLITYMNVACYFVML